MSAQIKLEKQDHIAVLTMSNPPANTWTRDTLVALKTLVHELNADKNIYSLVITGEGEKFFSAGADLNVFASGDKGIAADMSFVFGQAFEALSDFRGVSIAAINGFAMGGGLEVALACDIRIIEQQAQVALPEAKVGLLPCAGGTQNLATLVGEGWAKRMILCGERLKADKALSIGLVEEVVDTGASLAHALALAKKVEDQSPVAVAACKTLIQQGRFGSTRGALPLEREMFVGLFDTKDQKEGVQAFLEKRKANWVNG
ncbi:enoyl-CoA hydratase [Pseudoalteromonas denitrificans]|uniref:Enoyl-CoA hydratase/carnithine racemase n=1 Tax=Pseudoalteromonas denitrificans DSM 6059 TaxID=1123010 RepID=A0A1I1LZQ6_9GAMM|nr:enoyl-CoA hydratase [Pseudoalteromonas denitrificans]SFC78594.1 Enoyl-CoA hydratase/carnithine racemase [Pseudoalteromonas denitrificans DSM 6059]